MGYKDGRVGGNPVVRVACPMCGWWRQLESYGISQKTLEPRVVKFDKVDVENGAMLRVEVLKGAGRGSRNASVDLVETKGLRELPEELKAQIKRQAQRILAVLGG